ncbi:MAG: hypothetical protein ABSB22_22450 [Thermodesulfobacteriota bacterium]|jgi:REP element-mobilizing transposase RayT
MPRQAWLEASGTLHHVVIRGIERGRIIQDDQDRKHFVSRLVTLYRRQKRQYTWSLMTNHAHMLLRSGPSGFPKFSRRLLTGYSVTYNHWHHRSGYFFQNRYRSVVCDEDAYFRESEKGLNVKEVQMGTRRGRFLR